MNQLHVITAMFALTAMIPACGGCGEKDACRTVEFARLDGAPLDAVELTFDLEEDEVLSPLIVEVYMKGEKQPMYAPVSYDEETGRYLMIVPPHPDGIGGGEVKVQLHSEDGKCGKKTPFTIQPLAPAPGTLALGVERGRRLAGLQAAKLGYTADDLDNAEDVTELPTPLWGPAMSLVGLDDPTNPNSLLNIAQGKSELDISAEALEFAEALAAKSGIVDALGDTIEALEALEDPPEPIVMEHVPPDGRPSALLPEDFVTREYALCEGLLLYPSIGGPATLSYYMQLAEAAGGFLQDLDTVERATSALALVPNPYAASAGAVMATVLFHHKLLAMSYVNSLPTMITTPRAEVTHTTFNEDTTDVGEWTSYTVNADSKGWDATADMAQQILEALKRALKLSKQAAAFDKAVQKGGLVSKVGKAGASIAAKRALSKLTGHCVVPPMSWGPVLVKETVWSEVDWDGAIGSAPGNRWGYKPVSVGRGVLSLNVPPAAFPPASNKLASLLPIEIEVRPITVAVDPGLARLEPGKSLDVRAIVQNADNRDVEWILVEPPTATLVPTGKNRYGDPTATVTAPADGKGYPIRIAAQSTSSTGLRASGLPHRTGYGLYTEHPSIQVVPSLQCVEKGNSAEFEVIVIGGDADDVTWSATGGDVSPRTGEKVTYRPSKKGHQTITATHDGIGSSASAVAIVNECKCYYQVQIRGAEFASFSHFTEMSAMTSRGMLEINMHHPDGYTLKLSSLTATGFTVNVGVPGTYLMSAAYSHAGHESVVQSFISEDPGELKIHTWEDGYITGSFEGRVPRFGSRLEPGSNIEVYISAEFEMFVNEPTDIWGMVQDNCAATR